jgi:hypothetical protein
MRNLRRPLLALLICTSLWSGLISPVSAKGKKAAKPKVVKPTVSVASVRPRVTSAATAKNTMPVIITISGTGFGKPPASAKVTLLSNIESGDPTLATVTRATDTEIFAKAELPTGEAASIEGSVSLDIGDVSVDMHGAGDFKLTVDKPMPPPKPHGVEVDFKENNNSQTPTLHSVQITPKDPSNMFAADPTDPKAMKVTILPPGATNVVIDPVSTPDKTLITFTAAEGFKVQDVLVAVFDSNSSREPGAPVRRAAGKQPEKELKITRVDILSLQRRDGFGRLKIEGEGFGDSYGSPPDTSDLELICDPANRASHVDERDDTNKALRAADYKDPKKPKNTDTSGPNTSSLCTTRSFAENQTWRKTVEKDVHVLLVPRNPDLRVERTLIMSANDKMIDVYFEFSHWQDYSEPFRLERVSVSVTKPDASSASPAAASGPGLAPPTSATPTPKYTTQLASLPIGPQRDANLEYRYTVLDPNDASELFGYGVGKNFYVLQLSVVNNSDKKLMVPLSSIQAEVEWSYDAEGNPVYDEGSTTLSPLKLAAITSYFDTYQKTKGKKAKVFNILDGVSTLAAALVPVFGKGLERGNSILNGGLIPGLHKAWGDLSSQQLQNLTAMSWDSIEEIPAHGSKEKYVFIQRGDQVFGTVGSDGEQIRKRIKSLQGLDVSGFIVKDSESTSASPKP